MIHIAIIDDDVSYKSQLNGYVKKYSQENGEQFEVSLFSDGDEIVDGYKAIYDIIFLDIQMKIMDGMKTAQNIRKMDENVILVFITKIIAQRSDLIQPQATEHPEQQIIISRQPPAFCREHIPDRMIFSAIIGQVQIPCDRINGNW